MNEVLKLVTAQAVQGQLRREKLPHQQAAELVEEIADWRMRIRLWNLVHQRYIAALRSNSTRTATHLWYVLKETRIAI